MIDQTNYLDIGNLFFNEIVGDFILGLIVGILVIVIVGSKFKFHSEVMIGFCVIWIAACVTYNPAYIVAWMLSVLAISALFYYTISKLLSR